MSFNQKDYQKIYREKYKEKAKEYARNYYLLNKEKLNRINLDNKKSNPERILWQSAKDRALKFNLPFDIEISDVVIPKYCKILGIPLFKGSGGPTANSPSLDRIIPELGYIKENIQVISFKANTMKSNATKDEMILFSIWVLENYLD